jgi:hypothetical protein
VWMEFTPKDWFMMRIGLIFCEGDPDPEDAWVRSYLQEHALEPRRQVREERQGVACEALYFGQCYLGRHLQHLQHLYQKGLERSLLLEKLRELRGLPGEPRDGRPLELRESTFDALLPMLAEALHEQVKFGTDSEGYLTLDLDQSMVWRELSRHTTSASPEAMAGRPA